MKFPIWLVAAFLPVFCLVGCNAAYAQASSAIVVSSCGTPPTTYAAGQNRQVTQDTTGKLCGASTSTPSGTQDSNLKQVNGATVNVGTGASSTGTQRVTTSTDSTIGITGTLPAFAATPTVTANAGTGTFAVSAASLPLPTGAATVAKQPALGIAGTASTDVLTVQGIAGATALNANLDSVVDGVTVAASAASAVDLTNTPFSTVGFAAVELHITALTATSITASASYDSGSNYNTVQCRPVNTATIIFQTATLNATGVYECPTGTNFKLTQVGAGASTVKVALKRIPTALLASRLTTAVCSGTSSAGCATVVGSVAATANSTSGNWFGVTSLNQLYNGSTTDLAKSASAAASLNTGIGVAAVEESGRPYCHISTATTTTCKSGAGFLHTLTVNTLGTVASTATIYDNTAASGTVIAVINTLAGQTSYRYDVAFSTGLTVVTTGTAAPDITISYR